MNQNLIDALKNTRPSWEAKSAQEFSSLESQVASIDARVSKIENEGSSTFQVKEFKSDEDQKEESRLFDDGSEQTTAISEESKTHPWKILLRVIPNTNPKQYEFKVEANSNLYSGLGGWNTIEVAGLDTWQEANTGVVILAGNIENFQCTDAVIFLDDGDLEERVVFSGDPPNQFQTNFSTKLGSFSLLGGNGPSLVQEAFPIFTLMQNCVDSVPVIYPFAT